MKIRLIVALLLLVALSLACQLTTPKRQAETQVATTVAAAIQQAVEATLTAATTTPSAAIPFSVPSNSMTLNPVLQWVPGGGNSSYNLTSFPNALTLIAGPGTSYGYTPVPGPMVQYRVSGNFVAQVKVITHPVQDYQGAGLGILSTDGSIRNYLVLHRHISGNNQCIAAQDFGTLSRNPNVSVVYYSPDMVYLKLERRGALYNLYYSADGKQWLTFAENYAMETPEDATLFLVAFSTNDKNLVAQFSDFAVTLLRPNN